MLGHAAFMSNPLGCVTYDMVYLKSYFARITALPAFDKAIRMA